MKKIYKLKEWYSLEDAAERLTLTLGENVHVKDVLQLAIEGHLRLSWYMRHVAAIQVEYGEKVIPPMLKVFPEQKEPIISIGFHAVKGQESVAMLSGSHHVLLEHCGALSDYLLAHITNTGGELLSLDGYYVQDSEGVSWKIMEHFDDESLKHIDPEKKLKAYDVGKYFPSGEWPEISELGFTKSDLEAFENSLQPKEGKQVSTRERQTLYKMIIGMAKDGYGYDPAASRSPFPKELEGILDRLGISVSDDTLREKLKEASELLPKDTENPDN